LFSYYFSSSILNPITYFVHIAYKNASFLKIQTIEDVINRQRFPNQTVCYPNFRDFGTDFAKLIIKESKSNLIGTRTLSIGEPK
jgi:hypothetical protein